MPFLFKNSPKIISNAFSNVVLKNQLINEDLLSRGLICKNYKIGGPICNFYKIEGPNCNFSKIISFVFVWLFVWKIWANCVSYLFKFRKFNFFCKLIWFFWTNVCFVLWIYNCFKFGIGFKFGLHIRVECNF